MGGLRLGGRGGRQGLVVGIGDEWRGGETDNFCGGDEWRWGKQTISCGGPEALFQVLVPALFVYEPSRDHFTT